MSISRRSLPPLNALRAFEVSGRTLSFRAAGEELGVTQGAVAQQVRLLEDHIGLALFERLPRGVALTSQGAAYLSDVTRAFDTLGDATEQLLVRSEAVTISVTPTFATRLLIPQLAALNAALPGMELRTVATETVSDFDRDQVNIAVRLTRPPFPASFEACLLFRQELVPVASPHLVGALPLPLTPGQIQKLPLLHDAHNHFPKFFSSRGSLPGAVFNQTGHALDAALAGQGVAIVCRTFVQADLDAGRLIAVADTRPSTGPDYYIVRKRVSSPRKAVDAVWDWCIATWTVHPSAEHRRPGP
ncbi:LysR substrate-binding domain-containing protein [Roseibium sp. AS2]|uniref:LysR substrate-binding domain-containing protein n=2 Tax=unclassified Roseibium TaxID=2629323 RepID=UPI00316F960D